MPGDPIPPTPTISAIRVLVIKLLWLVYLLAGSGHPGHQTLGLNMAYPTYATLLSTFASV